MSEYDSSIIFMPLAEAQLYFNQPTASTVLEVLLDNPDDVDALRPKIDRGRRLRQIYITDWRQRNATFFTALQVERNVMFLILTLIVLVAALNIISGLIMLVKDKGHDIAILRTMGATRGAVMRIFFITGASIGIVGTLAGLALGVLVCTQHRTDPRSSSPGSPTPSCSRRSSITCRSCRPRWIPARRPRWSIMALVLSFLATLYPVLAGLPARSRRSLALRVGGAVGGQIRRPALHFDGSSALTRKARRAHRGAEGRDRVALCRRDRGAARARPAPASRRCSISPACSNGLTAAPW